MRTGKVTMPQSECLLALHAEYRSLANAQVRWPSDDLVQSLRYYEADVAFATEGIDLSPKGRVAVWVRNVYALEDFIETTGHFPQDNRRRPVTNFTPEHLRLISWVGTQRRATLSGLRCTYQLRRLDVVPGYAASSVDGRWNVMFERYRAWIETAPAPRYRSPDAEERSLANWGAKQRVAYRRGTLDSSRVEKLEQLRIWGWGL
jgi:hypothetical protein